MQRCCFDIALELHKRAFLNFDDTKTRLNWLMSFQNSFLRLDETKTRLKIGFFERMILANGMDPLSPIDPQSPIDPGSLVYQ